MARIPPTVGRVVLFHPRRDDNIAKVPGQPLAAIICGVPTPDDLDGKISLAVFSAHGGVHGYDNVTLVQPGEALPAAGVEHATWMAFQIGQAARTEVAESAALANALAAGSPAP